MYVCLLLHLDNDQPFLSSADMGAFDPCAATGLLVCPPPPVCDADSRVPSGCGTPRPFAGLVLGLLEDIVVSEYIDYIPVGFELYATFTNPFNNMFFIVIYCDGENRGI